MGFEEGYTRFHMFWRNEKLPGVHGSEVGVPIFRAEAANEREHLTHGKEKRLGDSDAGIYAVGVRCGYGYVCKVS